MSSERINLNSRLSRVVFIPPLFKNRILGFCFAALILCSGASAATDIVRMGSKNQKFTFSYKSKKAGLGVEIIETVFPEGWSAPQNQNSRGEGYVEFEISGGKITRVVIKDYLVRVELEWVERKSRILITRYRRVLVPNRRGFGAFITSVSYDGKEFRPLQFQTGIKIIDSYRPSSLADSKAGFRAYTVKKGDTLWGIAEKYGAENNPHFWPAIVRANINASGSYGDLKDPNFLIPGMKLSIPRALTEKGRKQAAYLSGITAPHIPKLGLREEEEFDYLLKPITGTSKVPNASKSTTKVKAPMSPKTKDLVSNLDSADFGDVTFALKGLLDMGENGIAIFTKELNKSSIERKLKLLQSVEANPGGMRKMSHIISPMVVDKALEIQVLRTLDGIFKEYKYVFGRTADLRTEWNRRRSMYGSYVDYDPRATFDLRPEMTVGRLAELCKKDDWRAAHSAAWVLQVVGQEALFEIETILELARNRKKHTDLRIAAVRTLEKVCMPSDQVPIEIMDKVVKILEVVKRSKVPRLGRIAADTLKVITKTKPFPEDSISNFLRKLKGNFTEIEKETPSLDDPRPGYVWVLGRAGPAAVKAIPELLKLLNDADPKLRSPAAIAIGKIRDKSPRVRVALVNALKSASGSFVQDLEWALSRIRN